MADRKRTPDPHPQLERLVKPDAAPEVEDVVALVGFVGPRDPEGPLRLYADEDGQRYIEIPFADFVDSEPVPDDKRQRTRIYVKRALMTDHTFGDPDPDPESPQSQMLQNLQDAVVGPTLSLWQFLPQNRLVAAELLGMLPEVEWRRFEPETGS